MSNVSIRSPSGLWIPISAPSGVPNSVNAQTLGGQWRSIVGQQDPVSNLRYIRNAANTGWIQLDQFAVKDPPTLPYAARFIQTTGANINARAPTGVVIGDLCIGYVASNYAASAVTFSSAAVTILQQQSLSGRNGALFAFISTGNMNTNYPIACSQTGSLTSIVYVVRGVSDGVAACSVAGMTSGQGTLVTISQQLDDLEARPYATTSPNNLGVSFWCSLTGVGANWVQSGGDYVLGTSWDSTIQDWGTGIRAVIPVAGSAGSSVFIGASCTWAGGIITVAP